MDPRTVRILDSDIDEKSGMVDHKTPTRGSYCQYDAIGHLGSRGGLPGSRRRDPGRYALKAFHFQFSQSVS